ncbi:MAG: SAM-dependent methyltransferase [Anaerolineales bacterium]
MSQNEYRVSPIGQVKAGPEGFALQVAPEYRVALEGLEDFGYIQVLWWSHHLDTPEYRSVMVTEQPYRNAPAELGIFATRSPLRPNPICLSTAMLLGVDRENGLVSVAWIDAEDGTPILDIKPYHPSSDRVRNVQLPEWCRHWPEWYEESDKFDWEVEFINAR